MDEADLPWLHARRDRIELLTIEVSLRLRELRTRIADMEARMRAERLSTIERYEYDEWLERELVLRKAAARLAQEGPEIDRRIAVETTRRMLEAVKR